MHCLLLPLVLASRSPASPHLSPLADCLSNQQENARRRCLPTRVWSRRCRPAQHADRVVTNEQLLRAVFGAGYEDAGGNLRVYIAGLRKKLETDPARPQFIITEPGVGYRLRAD